MPAIPARPETPKAAPTMLLRTADPDRNAAGVRSAATRRTVAASTNEKDQPTRRGRATRWAPSSPGTNRGAVPTIRWVANPNR